VGWAGWSRVGAIVVVWCLVVPPVVVRDAAVFCFVVASCWVPVLVGGLVLDMRTPRFAYSEKNALSSINYGRGKGTCQAVTLGCSFE